MGAHNRRLKMAQRGEAEDGLGWGGLVASKAELREERRQAALERDAARYRFLRAVYHIPISTEAARNPEVYDAAIDAAMAKAGVGGAA
jgi:hypothetical protein